MLNEDYKYVNSNGEVLDFKSAGINVNESTLHDYSWKYSILNGKITQFSKETESFPLELTVNLRGKNNYAKEKNKIFEHFEKDIINNKMGYLEKNGYRLYCFVIENKKKDYLIAERYMKIEATLLCEKKVWIRPLTFSFEKAQTSQILSDNAKTYPYHYPYIYGKVVGVNEFVNDSLSKSKFKIVIYGPAVNPTITINERIYGVDYSIADGEYCIIDSNDRTIYLYDVTGVRKSLFDYRVRSNQIFDDIDVGLNSIAWSASFGFDLIVFDERSELPWI